MATVLEKADDAERIWIKTPKPCEQTQEINTASLIESRKLGWRGSFDCNEASGSPEASSPETSPDVTE